MTFRRVQIFLVVFLSVLCTGVGISGAAAVWSQSATLATTVTAGTWIDYTRPGWSMPLDVSATRTDYNGLGRYSFRFAWTPEKTPETTNPVDYRVQLEATDSGRAVSDDVVTVKDPNRTASMTVQRVWFRDADFRLTITPVINGVAGEPTVKTLRTTTWGGYDFG